MAALIGLLATLEGELMRDLGDHDALPEWAQRVAARMHRDGVAASATGNRDLRQALSDLNHRLRYVLGEYAEPPESDPVP